MNYSDSLLASKVGQTASIIVVDDKLKLDLNAYISEIMIL